MRTGWKRSARAVMLVAMAMPSWARAQTHAAPPVSRVGDPSCVAMDPSHPGDLGRCWLRAEHRSLEVVAGESGRMMLVFRAIAAPADAPADDSLAPVVSAPAPIAAEVAVQDDLLERVQDAKMSADDATAVASELSSFDGTVYALPDFAQLKKDLGFTEQAAFDENDLRELVRAHLQVTLGIGAVTAAYLADAMGVVPAEEPAAPVSEPNRN